MYHESTRTDETSGSDRSTLQSSPMKPLNPMKPHNSDITCESDENTGCIATTRFNDLIAYYLMGPQDSISLPGTIGSNGTISPVTPRDPLPVALQYPMGPRYDTSLKLDVHTRPDVTAQTSHCSVVPAEVEFVYSLGSFLCFCLPEYQGRFYSLNII